MEKLKFPYGISDYYRIVTGNYFYVDRTNHIRLIEEAGDQILFLRPRRFGKSLLLSMLENYYDVAKADQFSQLFCHLAIGKNPTPIHIIDEYDNFANEVMMSNQELSKSRYDALLSGEGILKVLFTSNQLRAGVAWNEFLSPVSHPLR